MQKANSLISIILLLVVVLIGGWYFYKAQQPTHRGFEGADDNRLTSTCPQDAKFCPDGSSVSRTGPNCEFTKCPQGSPSTSSGQLDTSSWKTYRNEEYGFEFRYPQDFLVGKYKSENTPADNVSPDIQNKLSDLSSNNAIVLVGSDQVALFSKTPKSFSIDSIPIGKVPDISIKPITTSADFYRRNFIESDKTWEGKEIKIGEYVVTKLPGYPGPYGDSVYYYLLPISDNLIVEFVGFKEKILTNTTMTESHYDKIIEDIISTFSTFKFLP